MNIKIKTAFLFNSLRKKPEPVEFTKKQNITNRPFRNTNCKHYSLCLNYVIFIKKSWYSFSCSSCQYQNDNSDRPKIGEFSKSISLNQAVSRTKIIINQGVADSLPLTPQYPGKGGRL